MTRTENPLARFLIYIALALFTIYNIFPFVWTIMSSIKLPKDANARIPRFTFSPTGDNYAELWLNMRPEDFAPYGLALVIFIFLLVVIGFSANRIPAPNSLIYMGCILAGVLVAVALPDVVNTAEFYDYLINSVIVTIGTLCVSLTIGALAGYGLARFRHVVSVYILVIALAFRSLPSLALVLPFYYLGQLSGLYDTHILLIFCLVAVNQPFTIWMLRSFFMEIPVEIEEAAMIDGAGRLKLLHLGDRADHVAGHHHHRLVHAAAGLQRLFAGAHPDADQLDAAGRHRAIHRRRRSGSCHAGGGRIRIRTTLPILVVIIFFQKYLIRGLASGAVKG